VLKKSRMKPFSADIVTEIYYLRGKKYLQGRLHIRGGGIIGRGDGQDSLDSKTG
jgi:hypothetical protein